MSVLPPELMSSEQREARAAEIRREIPREWLRFAIAEWIVLLIPFGVFLALYSTTDLIPDVLLVPAVILAIGAGAGLTLYWVFRRVQPLQKELEQLEGG